MTLAAGTTSPPSWCRSRSGRREDRGPSEENSLMSQPAFTVDVDHNQYLYDGARDVSAIATSPATLRHAILLTDGRNQHETPEELAGAITASEGYFSCDCRGVGTDWEVSELRKVSTALLGTVDIVPDPAGLAADFESMMQT